MVKRNPNLPHERKILGFICIRKLGHPAAMRGGYVHKHRLVMEEHLGRLLTKDERIIHINGIKEDNRLENIKLFANQNELSRYKYSINPEPFHKRTKRWKEGHPDRYDQVNDNYYQNNKTRILAKQAKENREKKVKRLSERVSWLEENWLL